ncbi:MULTISPECIES: TonB-dependent receptor [unclassified Sphingomonas]|uniref:TonB-dependent receptor plug domain-containing protein n=1 Tax=unclassified Sphingomonas TaxID=196159 RepID=UPI000A45BD46|nr:MULTISPECIES: TonB-dependent receptor [unclassified Sphingomonas]
MSVFLLSSALLARGHRFLKPTALATTALATLSAGGAWAQEVAPVPGAPQIGPIRQAPAQSGGPVNTSGAKPAPAATGIPGDDLGDEGATPKGDIVVTGSRIVRDGYAAPTPVSVLGAAEIAAQAPANIADFVNTLPSIAGSGTSATSSGSLSNGIAGINSISLRGLGVGRTLVLVDGQRSVASSIGGVVDINTIPQDLVERVEVVTGGASAQYGSDAVGGVVNFILNKNFKGVELKVDNGVSTYGDGMNYRFSGSAGFSALDDRLHVLVNAEYFHQDGVDTINRGWNNADYFQINNPAYTPTNGQPQRLVGSGFGVSTYTTGGLITSGPLAGTYFLGNNQTAALNFGTRSAVSSPWMIGGDYKVTMAGHRGTNSLLPTEERIGVFNRVAYDLTNDIQIYGQFSWNRYEGQSFYQQTPSTGVTIQPDNAYLRTYYPTLAAQVTAPFTIGTSNNGFPAPGSDNRREVYRYVAGVNGKFGLFGRTWKWNAYYQHGMTKAHEELTNTWNVARMALAQDAVIVTSANVGSSGLALGSIACRSTLTAPTNGCVPVNRLGIHGGPDPKALAYIYGAGQPYRDETIKEDVAAASASGELFNLPGGPAAVALGAEWRKEQISGYVPTEYQPVRNANGTTTNNWLYGNYLPNFGEYNVKEGFIEVDLPIVKGINLNAAGRYTDYSTSGAVQTWKVGGTYTPLPDIKFRATYSHDIRAPNLQELFASGTARTNSVIMPANSPLGAGAFQFVESTIGNPNLKPEKANTWTAGAVATPRWLPGFTMSFDYYDIRITDAIGSITSQNTVDFCYSGSTAYCNNIVYNGGALSQIVIQPFNFASQHETGFDIDATYRTDLSAISADLPGSFSISTAITHYIKNVINNGIFPIDYAGVNGGSLAGTYNAPHWVYRVSAFYKVDPVTINLVARGFGSGVYGNDYIQCTSGCPASTNQYRTINNNHIPGATYFDASISFKFSAGSHDGSLTFVVNNMFNKDPVLVGNGPDGNNVPAYAQTSRQLYDVVGRVFRVSAGVKF